MNTFFTLLYDNKSIWGGGGGDDGGDDSGDWFCLLFNCLSNFLSIIGVDKRLKKITTKIIGNYARKNCYE